MLWLTLWFTVILKIPALYLAYVIWWSVKDPPTAGAGGADRDPSGDADRGPPGGSRQPLPGRRSRPHGSRDRGPGRAPRVPTVPRRPARMR